MCIRDRYKWRLDFNIGTDEGWGRERRKGRNSGALDIGRLLSTHICSLTDPAHAHCSLGLCAEPVTFACVCIDRNLVEDVFKTDEQCQLVKISPLHS